MFGCWNLLHHCFHLLLDCFGHLQTNVFLWIRTCLQYAVPSVVSGIRLLLICEVALGECCDLTSIHRDLTAPPSGYHSCHGVKLTEDTLTDFVVIFSSWYTFEDILMNIHIFLKLRYSRAYEYIFIKGDYKIFIFLVQVSCMILGNWNVCIIYTMYM